MEKGDRMEEKQRLIVGMTGASGAALGYALLRALRSHPQVEIHLVCTKSARETLRCETALTYGQLTGLAHAVYDEGDLSAAISSGSFRTAGMVVIPCSMKSLAGIVSGYTDNLLLRAADVCLKEGRKLVLVPRETPFGKVHLRNLYQAADLGCAIIPPMLTFYSGADTVEGQIDHIIGKVLMQFGLSHAPFRPWEGPHGGG
jgi:4-hydroxy-3-polyprenylbenzoate decarboxylase